MSLSSKQKKFLKGIAHHMRPLVQVGKNGCTESLVKELNAVISSHELVKVKILSDDQQDFKSLAIELEKATDAEMIHKVGHTALFFRQKKEESAFDLSEDRYEDF
jgi:RNA-binding protein